MKQAKQFLFLLVLIVFYVDVLAQEQPGAQKFPLGAFVSGAHKTDQALYNSFIASGMNTMVQYADSLTKPFLQNLDVIASNNNSVFDYIGYYATSYYSKWESEENQTDKDRVGVKHKHGKDTTWQGVQCWSSLGLTAPADSLVYGPHYRQEKLYKRWYVSNRYDVKYTARFWMALNYNPESVSQNEKVCVIRVKYRYAEVYPDESWTLHDSVFRKDTLTVSDFNSDGSFKDIYFNEIPDTIWYKYPSGLIGDPLSDKMQLPASGDTTYSDSDGDNGIQFCVEWLRDDNLCILYIDNAEVYDNEGWDKYIDDPNEVKQKLTDYVQSYSDWNNIKYWYSQDEPYTIDAYTPMRIVDSLVKDAGGSSLITEFSPDWHITVNGDPHLARYYQMVNPNKLMIDYYPVSAAYSVVRWEDLNSLSDQLQISHSLQPGFWYVGQGYGLRTATDDWCVWRKPDSTELKATVMLALAHGSKGILFWNYDSYTTSKDFGCTGTYFDCIVDENLNPTSLYNLIKNNFAPRLNGTLGKTLLGLNYSGNYINMQYQEGPPPENMGNQYDYLSIQHYGLSYHWHAGFFQAANQPDNKYFLLANLRTTFSNTAKLIITNNTGFNNLGIRDIENHPNSINTTITTSQIFYPQIPAGEGYLFQVAPVALYGGKLVYNETVGNGMTLQDDMSIEPGAALTINGTYTAKANITIKAGGKIVSAENGKIIFDPVKN